MSDAGVITIRKVKFIRWFLLISIVMFSCTSVDADYDLYPESNRKKLEVLDSCPKESAQDISTEAIIKILVNKPLNPETVTQSNILLGNGRWLIRGSVFYDDRMITYVPTEILDKNTKYILYITTDLRDEDGFAITDNLYTLLFYTGDDNGISCR